MSEEINLPANNLCTTEDAFEVFQASSIYEEEEFITLSDLVSPPPETSAFPNVLDDIPFDNEVECLPCPNNQLSEVNTSSVPEEEQVSCPDTLPVNNTNNDTTKFNVESTQQDDALTTSSRPKRVRKKKFSYADECSLSPPRDNVPASGQSLPSARKRRARKPKNAKNDTDQNDPNLPAVSDLDQSIEQTPTRPKRGRKKKTVDTMVGIESEAPIQNISKSSEDENLTLFETLSGQENGSEALKNDDNTKVNNSRREGKRKNTKSVKTKNNSMDAVNSDPSTDNVETALNELFGLNNDSAVPIDDSHALDSVKTTEALAENENNTFNNSKSSTKRRRGRPRKRIILGRPRKKNTEEVHDSSKVETTEEDLEDEISLSTLSQKATASKEFLSQENVIENKECDINNELNLANDDTHIGINKSKESEDDNTPIDIEVDDTDIIEKPAILEDDNQKELNGELQRRNSNVSLMADNEYNVDNVVKENNCDEETQADNSLLVEDSTKRPVRRRAKQNRHYEEESDEDPFANIELSDDDEPKGRRKRYNSDDEYVPDFTESKKRKGRKRLAESDSDSSELDLEDIEMMRKDEIERKRKRNSNKLDTSPIKAENQDKLADINVTTIAPKVESIHEEDDIEVCLQSSIIKTGEDVSQKLGWSSGTEAFESFLANKIQGTDLKIKKVSQNEPSQSAPLEIPVIDQDAKRTKEISTQTNKIETKTTEMQTSTPFEIPMKKNISLTTEQSENACQFLEKFIKTTSELGQLMTQKSEDFISKKINTKTVVDTFKMDYCVQKSFLLFKLAKSNLMQMEEDLSKQYEEFLQTNNLASCREEIKKVTPQVKAPDSDSDCEIVEADPMPSKGKSMTGKSTAIPKTVFLNKELSIKIAKKPSPLENKIKTVKNNLNIKGKQSVWLNSAVMLKKVKPTQSFLAQDGRNKKPPDCYVTEKMVSDFFEDHYRQQVIRTCAPYTSLEWLSCKQNYVCGYFVVEPDKFEGTTSNHELNTDENSNDSVNDVSNLDNVTMKREMASPASLLSICTGTVQKHFNLSHDIVDNSTHKKRDADITEIYNPESLFQLSLKKMTNYSADVLPHPLAESDLDEQILEGGITLGMPDENMLYNKTENSFVINKENIDENSDSLSWSSNDLNENTMEATGFLEDLRWFDEEVSKTAIPDALTLKTLCYKKLTKLLFNENDTNVVRYNPETLAKLSYRTLSKFISVFHGLGKTMSTPQTLKSLCCSKILKLFSNIEESENDALTSNKASCCIHSEEPDGSEFDAINSIYSEIDDMDIAPPVLSPVTRNGIKSLFSLCFQEVQKQQSSPIPADITSYNKSISCYSPASLKSITFHYICGIIRTRIDDGLSERQIVSEIDTTDFKFNAVKEVKTLSAISFEIISTLMRDDSSLVLDEGPGGLTINSVNTMSEEAFLNIEGVNNRFGGDISEYDDEEENETYEDEFDGILEEEDHTEEQPEENSWVSQVQMKELISCSLSNKKLQKELTYKENCFEPEEPLSIAQVKLEPQESLEEQNEAENQIDPVVVKTEQALPPDEMISIPESIVTKQEFQTDPGTSDQDHLSFGVDSFENFATMNKLMHPLDEPNDIFSQSALRIRRQHDPDYVNDYEPNLGLLVPQTFEPLNIETAKDRLMQSSSEDEENNANKNSGRKRGRPKKKVTEKQTKAKEKPVAPPPPQPPVSEVAVLTRRMREKIRREEKKVVSSDSEGENVPLSVKRTKDKKDNPETANPTVDHKSVSEEIQCNDIDSTEQVEPSADPNLDEENLQKFTGFSAVDQNAVTSYQKYMKYVYEKIIPKVDEMKTKETETSTSVVNESNNRSESPLIDYQDPVEMLECEPTMPIFDENEMEVKQKKAPRKTKSIPSKEKPIQSKEKPIQSATPDKVAETSDINTSVPKYEEHNGWHCYPISKDDPKIFATPACLILEKLPESFVSTYFEYQQISTIHDEDEEVDRLINLNTLSRTTTKEGKHKTRTKAKTAIEPEKPPDGATVPGPVESPTFSEPCNEFSPSEDEGVDPADEVPPVGTNRETSENNLAKNSLMNDSDSDTTLAKVKEEAGIEAVDENEPLKKKKSKSHPKTHETQEIPTNPENLTLTADKMMKKELNLLHAPVTMNEEVPETNEKQVLSKGKKKSSGKHSSHRDRVRGEDDSSSDEEKQWVTTKEKLLKRMEKKHETAIEDDAKRTKLVNEFIEKREEGKGRRQPIGRGRRAKNSRKRLEREKQLRVLSHELYGEPGHTAKGASQNLFKGRRNIRKVIDKKSLARKTVIANMEEFERKRRLNQKQNKLREIFGLEEGVNVLVINNEVCLEYDLESHQPVVTVHSFFTKVMKAHQYEGVKFMWDACFESLASVESGSPGGGCILAHCMGLGKTLQVLALLHTVLTHPRVGMRRVLVCCPLSTVLNWVDEIHKWITPVTNEIKVFELSKLKKTYERAYQLEDWYNRGGIFIIGYELFRSLTTLDPELDDVRPTIVNKIRTALLDPGPDIIVCDEGHLLKNDCSVLAVAMSRVATKRRIVLTGTPMQNNLREYYCMVNFVKPSLLGTYWEYSNRFENPIMNGQHRDSRQEDIKLMKERTHILHKVLEGCLQRQEASVLYPYLPKKYEYTLFISLTPIQWDLYKYYVEMYANHAKKSVLQDFHVLQKIWTHPQVLHNFQMKAKDRSNYKLENLKSEKLEDDLAQADLAATEDIKPENIKTGDADAWWLKYMDKGSILESLESSNKFVVLFRILDECVALGDKILIFSTSLFTMDSLEYFLKKINKWSLGQEYYRLDGSVPAEVRQKWCREFNAEKNVKTKLFLISTRAGSLGLNMVAANRVIILDTSWNPAHDIQSIFRVYRFGQKKDCHIYRLVAMGTMEQKIYERSVTKQAVACRVVDEQQIERHYNMAELTELYRYDDTGSNVAAGVAAGVRDVALLRVARLPALYAVHEHDSLLRGSAEPSLPEDERDAVWMQFQEEHEHKQRQNELSTTVILKKALKRTIDQEYQVPVPEIPTTSNLLQYPSASNLAEATLAQEPEPKTKKGKKLTVPIPPVPKQKNEAKSIQDGLVKKIMDVLMHNNNKNLNVQEINKLVTKVRKIVAFGHVGQGQFDDEVEETIAKVILGDIPAVPSVNTVQENTVQDTQKRGRGRPRKTDVPDKDEYKPEKSVIFTHKTLPKKTESPRKAAIAANLHLGSIDDEVVDLDANDDWQADTDYTPEETVAEVKREKPKPKSKKKQSKTREETATQDKAKKLLNTELQSIILSDDDEPAHKSKETPKATEEEIIPLHPSLLSNKNFIKIIAHTYLEGNSSLDEDAATLAAQYSALKAKKEIESTGKPITSGPIYDIAVKVLGIEIIAKLHKSNIKEIKSEPTESQNKTNMNTSGSDNSTPTTETAPTTIKTEPETEPTKQTSSRAKPSILKAKSIKELTRPKSPPQDIKPEPLKLKFSTAKMAKAKSSPGFAKIMPTGVAMSAAGSSETTASPAVVPIGMFARAHSIAETPQMPTQKEESILPDDDDVIISDAVPTRGTPLNANPSKMQTLTLNKVTSEPPIPKIKISKGKIVLDTSTLPEQTNAPQIPNPVPSTSAQSDTICLDSDEDESITPTPQPPPKPRKLVAVKSTAKSQQPVKPTANSQQPVPVQLTMANNGNIVPDNSMLQTGVVNLAQAENMGMKYIVVPASAAGTLNLNNLPHGVLPSNVRNVSRIYVNQQNNQYPITTQSSGNAQPQTLLLNSQVDGMLNPNQLFSTIPPNQVPRNVNILNHNLNLASQNATATTYTLQPQTMIMRPNAPILAQNVVPLTSSLPTQRPQLTNIAPRPQNIATMNAPVGSVETSSPSVANSESILPTSAQTPTPKPGPASRKIQNKTLCKPGDILRITKTGQVEILNREPATESSSPPSKPVEESDDVAFLDNDPPASSSKANTTKKVISQRKSGRIRKISSSSSSSSDSSRPSSPDDPLAILKDVVHIQATDEPAKTPEKASYQSITKEVQDKLIGKTVTKKVTKDVQDKLIGKTLIKKVTPNTSAKSTPVKTPSRNSTVPNVSSAKKDKIIEQINKTNTVLKKLNDVLGPVSARKVYGNKNMVTIDAVDLTEVVETPKFIQKNKLTKEDTKVTAKTTPREDTKISSKNAPTKIVGTSKNIILTGSGKATVASTDNSAKKSVRVTNVEKIKSSSASWAEAKKRASTASTSAAKKKKTGTALDDLRFFNCDDDDDEEPNIDMSLDIIELE